MIGLLLCLGTAARAKPFTFAVVGDNQPSGYNTMRQNEVFRRIIADIKTHNPAFVIQQGDHVWGYQGNPGLLERMWKEYFLTAESFKPIPVYHSPGNHDLYDKASGQVWDRHFRKRYHAVEYGRSAFIFLDAETDVNRISGVQFKWLKSRLTKYRGWDNIFVAMHKPVFRPLANGTLYEDSASLDSHQVEYSRLIDALTAANIRMVFAGHYHQYDMDYRHGILQYISGGGGGEVEDDPARGFHHYLLVHVDGRKVDVEAVRISDTDWIDPVASRKAPFTLEDFKTIDSPLSWTMWDQSVLGELVRAPEGGSGNSLRIGYDFSRYEWPMLTLGTERPEIWAGATGISFRTYIAPGATTAYPELVVGIRGLKGSYSAPRIKLMPGWNQVNFKFSDRTWSWSHGKETKEGVALETTRIEPFTGLTFMLWGYERKDSGTFYLDDVSVN